MAKHPDRSGTDHNNLKGKPWAIAETGNGGTNGMDHLLYFGAESGPLIASGKS
jgi:hypothetical protein